MDLSFLRKLVKNMGWTMKKTATIKLSAYEQALDEATQKAFSLAEIKWTDRFVENPTELKSLGRFLENNHDIRRIIVTTRTRSGNYRLQDENVLFVPSAIYAYWVSAFLFKNKKRELLYSNEQ